MAAALAVALAGPAAAQDCRLALSLGLDVSSSVSTSEYRLQADGLAAALTDPAVAEAFLMSPGARVALHVFEWSGTEQQRVVLGWSWIEGPADLERVAAMLRATRAQLRAVPDRDRARDGLRRGGAGGGAGMRRAHARPVGRRHQQRRALAAVDPRRLRCRGS